LTIKETMAVTMIDTVNVKQKEFEDSHLLAKLKKAVIVARTVGKHVDDESFVYSVTEFDLSPETEMYKIIKEDYDLVRNLLLNDPNGFDKLTGKMGKIVQPRTKGGKNSNSRAFYVRISFLKKIIL